jgi:hypothetical protein
MADRQTIATTARFLITSVRSRFLAHALAPIQRQTVLFMSPYNFEALTATEDQMKGIVLDFSDIGGLSDDVRS